MLGMLGDKKKDLASIILSGPSKESEEPGGDSVGLNTAAEEMIAAIHAKDASALVEALKSFTAMSEESEESEEHQAEELSEGSESHY